MTSSSQSTRMAYLESVVQDLLPLSPDEFRGPDAEFLTRRFGAASIVSILRSSIQNPFLPSHRMQVLWQPRNIYSDPSDHKRMRASRRNRPSFRFKLANTRARTVLRSNGQFRNSILFLAVSRNLERDLCRGKVEVCESLVRKLPIPNAMCRVRKVNLYGVYMGTILGRFSNTAAVAVCWEPLSSGRQPRHKRDAVHKRAWGRTTAISSKPTSGPNNFRLARHPLVEPL